MFSLSAEAKRTLHGLSGSTISRSSISRPNRLTLDILNRLSGMFGSNLLGDLVHFDFSLDYHLDSPSGTKTAVGSTSLGRKGVARCSMIPRPPAQTPSKGQNDFRGPVTEDAVPRSPIRSRGGAS